MAKKGLDLSKLVGKATEAKERRLVPETVEDFFLGAAPIAGIHPKEIKKNSHRYTKFLDS